jgi:hypothetical protein
MAILDALGAYLQTQGQGTLATDIFWLGCLTPPMLV